MRDDVQIQQALRQAWGMAIESTRQWLLAHNITAFSDRIDRRVAMAVLEQSMRNAVLEVLNLDDMQPTVHVGEVEGAGEPRWYLSLFGFGIWSEQFDPGILLHTQSEVTHSEDRSA